MLKRKNQKKELQKDKRNCLPEKILQKQIGRKNKFEFFFHFHPLLNFRKEEDEEKKSTSKTKY